MQSERKIGIGDTVRLASRPDRIGMVVATHAGEPPRHKGMRWVAFRDGFQEQVEASRLELLAPLPKIG